MFVFKTHARFRDLFVVFILLHRDLGNTGT